MRNGSNNYNAADLEVLRGLEPVKRRPGMYTDTTRPNHLAQEVIDNAVDEAIAGFADRIEVTHFKDGSLQVIDNGRGMPVDTHPEEKVSGAEVIMTRLHAGAKFGTKNYQFSGGLHGVGVSVVNALSSKLDVEIRRNGLVYQMSFKDGKKSSELKTTGKAPKSDTGTKVRFWPNAAYFETTKFSLSRLRHTLRAKAVLCPRLTVTFFDEPSGETQSWYFEDGLKDYLVENLQDFNRLPEEPFVGHVEGKGESVSWAVIWLPDGGDGIAESYANLIPTPQGGTHVAGFRSGLLASLRDFGDFRGFIPKGVKLTPEDIWERCSYVLSAKLSDLQFSGQTKERLSSRECTAFIASVVQDAFSHFLNQNPEVAQKLCEMAIENARRRLKEAAKVVRRKVGVGPALPGKLTDCISQNPDESELFMVEGDSAGGSAKQARDKKILNTWEEESGSILQSKEIHDIAVAIGVDPGSSDLSGLRYGKTIILADADSDGLHIATLLCGLFLRHFRPLVVAGKIFVAMPPLYRIDQGAKVFYAIDEQEKNAVLKRLNDTAGKGKVNVQRFKGLGEMNPLQLRETTIHPETRRLVQLTLPKQADGIEVMDMLLSKKRVKDRKQWLEEEGDKAEASLL
ncbi:MAG: DNA topoisomerase IV subunit B [Desulfobacterales bacterium]|nr:DNA topoisomerase IV subunit B [Desulfobacterales bacterium]